MRSFLALLAAFAVAGGLVWLALRPPRGSGSAAVPERIERIEAEGLAWLERDPATGRLRLKVETDTALRVGDLTTTGPIRAWLYPETGTAPPTEVVAASGRLASQGRQDPIVEEVSFDGTTRVRLPDGIALQGSGIRWSRASARVESDDPIRMEGDTGGWIEGSGFTLDPARRVVRIREVRGAWPM